MDKLYARHDNYLSDVPMGYIRGISNRIDWGSRLIILKGPKGVGKSTIMKQFIKQNSVQMTGMSFTALQIQAIFQHIRLRKLLIGL